MLDPSMSINSETVVIYHAGWQLVKVRFLMALSLAMLAASLWAGYHFAASYGVNPADGGQLAPLPIRLAWAGAVILVGVAFAGGMTLYGHFYVARIEYDPPRRILRIFTTRPVGVRLFTCPVSDLAAARQRVDHARGSAIPWLAIRVQGRRWPLIVDLQGTFPEPELGRQLLKVPPHVPLLPAR